MSKRIVSLLMLLALVSALLAACGSPTPPTTTTQATGAAADAPTAEATAAAAETRTETTAAETATGVGMIAGTTTAGETATVGETATTGEITMAGATAVAALPNVSALNLPAIKIAMQGPLSGPQAAFGTAIRNGAQLAVEQLAPRLGLQVELVPMDDQATDAVGAANAEEIVADQDIFCVVGHYNSSVALASLLAYKDAGLLMVSPGNTNPRVTDDFVGIAYRVIGRDDVQGVVAAEYASTTLQASSVYVLHDLTVAGQGQAEIFRRAAEARGLTIAGFVGIESTTVDFGAALAPIQAAQPDLVYFGGIYNQGGPLVRQMREQGIQARFMMPDGIDAPDFARLASEAGVGTQYTTTGGPPSQFPGAAQMAQDYQAKFGAPAPPYSPQAYDAAGVCMATIAMAAETANGKPTRQQVLDAIKELGVYRGITGEIDFNENGDPTQASYFIQEVTSADPARWSDNRIVQKLEREPPAQGQ